VGEREYGIPFPGTFLVDHDGVVSSKYFESLYQDRYSAPTILLRESGSASGTRETVVKTPHLEIKSYTTRQVVRPNLRFTLVAKIELKPKMHVYAPGVEGFIPIDFQIDPSPNYRTQPVTLPKAEKLYLAPIQQTAQVYRGKFQITRDVNMASSDILQPILGGSRELKIAGHLRYQACDDKICYLPRNVPLEWQLKVEPLDRERVPEPIQHKATPPAAK
jgi:cytochrome c biogenesis DsbD-like protein